MTLPQYYDLSKYWADHPPEHEILGMLAQAFTSWEPKSSLIMTVEEHRESLEARWKSGVAMNVKQLFEATGGLLSLDGRQGAQFKGAQLPGIGPFPGAH
jgi:hypothetical protein